MATTTTRRIQQRDTPNQCIKSDERGLIDRADRLTGKTRTDFVLDAARRTAVEALTDRTLFRVDTGKTMQRRTKRRLRRRRNLSLRSRKRRRLRSSKPPRRRSSSRWSRRFRSPRRRC